MISPIHMEGKWVASAFEGISDTGKTHRMAILSKESADRLGEIRWYGAWRKYAFFPDDGTIFENDCLRDIAVFIERLMSNRKPTPPATNPDPEIRGEDRE